MAKQKLKTQVDKTAASKNKTKLENRANNSEKKGTVTVNSVPSENKIPVRLITSVTFLALFILFLVVSFKPGGVIIELVENLIHGLIGRAGFIVSILGLLYLFIIHAFSGKRPVKMRSICVICFVILCGCISHLSLTLPDMPMGAEAFKGLYSNGISGTSGGLICGSIAMLFFWLVRGFLSYLIFILAALFCLLGAMQITITSIIRAIQDRPRPEWEEEPKERQEPASDAP